MQLPFRGGSFRIVLAGRFSIVEASVDLAKACNWEREKFSTKISHKKKIYICRSVF